MVAMVEAGASGRPGFTRGSGRPKPPPLRLTRRGRVVLAVALMLLLAGLVALLAPASRAADPATGAPATTVVRQGDTLWAIAERQLPGRDPIAVVAEIRRLNGLDDYTVYAGQQLVLPAWR
ncbi:LysM peptidoglycan-binding domain-containing protein [Plantactinospora siamensis]|uniref:LysM peptidoglycan-binding domain-containing protein n=1 Tax=Plantactinospora siamensis TaxID=555372 RepID=A0ABV6NSJ3_9ACTN